MHSSSSTSRVVSKWRATVTASPGSSCLTGRSNSLQYLTRAGACGESSRERDCAARFGCRTAPANQLIQPPRAAPSRTLQRLDLHHRMRVGWEARCAAAASSGTPRRAALCGRLNCTGPAASEAPASRAAAGEPAPCLAPSRSHRTSARAARRAPGPLRTAGWAQRTQALRGSAGSSDAAAPAIAEPAHPQFPEVHRHVLWVFVAFLVVRVEARVHGARFVAEWLQRRCQREKSSSGDRSGPQIGQSPSASNSGEGKRPLLEHSRAAAPPSCTTLARPSPARASCSTRGSWRSATSATRTACGG